MKLIKLINKNTKETTILMNSKLIKLHVSSGNEIKARHNYKDEIEFKIGCILLLIRMVFLNIQPMMPVKIILHYNINLNSWVIIISQNNSNFTIGTGNILVLHSRNLHKQLVIF